MKRKLLAALCVTAMSASLLAGCGSSDKTEDTTKTEETKTEETSDQEKTATDSSSDSSEVASEEEGKEAGFSDGSETEDSDSENESTGVLLDTSEELTGTHHAEIEVKDYGTIEVELDADTAPITVTNFVKLAQEGFYDGLTFHRIMDGFMIQGGDPNGNGTGGSDENIKGEFSSNGVENNISHTHCLLGNQQQLNMNVFPVGDQTLHCGKCLNLKWYVFLLIEIIHKVQGIVYFKVTDCKNVLFQ